jgi:hypothetical protein
MQKGNGSNQICFDADYYRKEVAAAAAAGRTGGSFDSSARKLFMPPYAS